MPIPADAAYVAAEAAASLIQWQFQVANVASVLLGVSVFLTMGRVILIVDRHIRTFAEDWEFEQSRRVRLRLGSTVYRLTEPLIDELCESRLVAFFNRSKVQLALDRGGAPLPWTASEFIAVSLMEALILFLVVTLLGSGAVSGVSCFLVGTFFALIYLKSTLSSLQRKAQERVEAIQRRMPFGIDLVALLMRAGAGFRDAVGTVISEGVDHPFSTELRRVLDDVNRGKTLRAALTEFAERIRCDDVREMVYAIQKSEELGTPLAEIFANLADQMRLRKSQWAEAEAGRAQIKMQGPQFVIMVACMITILVPFIFDALGGTAVL
jgi:tight adherence protein C